MEYNQPFGPPGVVDTDAPYVNGDPEIGKPGSIPPAEAIEYPQREIVYAIEDSGQTPTNTDLTQLAQAIRRASRIYAVDQGSANNVVITPVPVLTSYIAGVQYEIDIAATNTGATTINVSNLGTRDLVRMTGAPLTSGDIVQDGIALVVYDGLKFQLLTSSASQVTEQSLVHYGVDTGPVNALVATVSPGISGYNPGLFCLIAVSHTNTGAATINLNGKGVKPIVRVGGAALSAGDLLVGSLAEIAYDGTNFELLNVQVSPVSGGGDGGDNSLLGPLRPYFIAVNSATVTSPPSGPALGDTYLVPVGATGGWAGLDNQVSQYAGSSRGWVTRDFPRESMVGVADQDDYWKRTSSGWRTIFASLTEADAGISTVLAVTPACLRRAASIVGPLRPYFIAVISATTTTPPASPVKGDTYLVPGAATGAWSGFANYLTQWDGFGWLFRDYPIQSMIGIGDSDDFWKRTGTGWRSIWATNDEAWDGTSISTTISPASLWYVLNRLPRGDDQLADLLFYGST